MINTLDPDIPLEIQVIPYGYHETPKGAFLCDEESAALVIEAFNSRQNDMVIDYEHQTMSGAEAPAAGWIKELIYKGSEGIWARVEWTARAVQYLGNREYRYVSPVFVVRVSDAKVVNLLNVALTNQPNIDGMVPIVNKGVGDTKNEEARKMEKVSAVLGLPEAATEREILKAVEDLKGQTQVIANNDVLAALGLKEGSSQSEVVGTIMAMKQADTSITGLIGRVKELEGKLNAKEADELVAMAMKEGKLTPAQKDWAKDYAVRDAEGFKVFAAKALPVIVTGEIAGDTTKPTGIDETQKMVNKMLGISEATYNKYAGAKEA